MSVDPSWRLREEQPETNFYLDLNQWVWYSNVNTDEKKCEAAEKHPRREGVQKYKVGSGCYQNNGTECQVSEYYSTVPTDGAKEGS